MQAPTRPSDSGWELTWMDQATAPSSPTTRSHAPGPAASRPIQPGKRATGVCATPPSASTLSPGRCPGPLPDPAAGTTVGAETGEMPHIPRWQQGWQPQANAHSGQRWESCGPWPTRQEETWPGRWGDQNMHCGVQELRVPQLGGWWWDTHRTIPHGLHGQSRLPGAVGVTAQGHRASFWNDGTFQK